VKSVNAECPPIRNYFDVNENYCDDTGDLGENALFRVKSCHTGGRTKKLFPQNILPVGIDSTARVQLLSFSFIREQFFFTVISYSALFWIDPTPILDRIGFLGSAGDFPSKKANIRWINTYNIVAILNTTIHLLATMAVNKSQQHDPNRSTVLKPSQTLPQTTGVSKRSTM
jgi:hypothetical protein